MGKVKLSMTKGFLIGFKRVLRIPGNPKDSRLKTKFPFAVDFLKMTDPLPPFHSIIAVSPMVPGEIRLVVGSWH